MSTNQNSYYCTPKEPNRQINRVKDNFTFRNRNIKFGVLKKIDLFLDVIQTEEKMIKKDKSSCLNELNTLQNKIKMHYPKCFKS